MKHLDAFKIQDTAPFRARIQRAARSLVALLPLVTLSCGTEVRQSNESTATTAEALGCSDDLWMSAPDTQPLQQRCESAWEYHPYVAPCYSLRRDPSCPIERYEQYDCTPYPMCTVPQNFTALSQNFVITGSLLCIGGPQGPSCSHLPPTAAQCTAFAQSKAATIARVVSFSGTLGAKVGTTQANCFVRVTAQRDVSTTGPVCDPNNLIPRVSCDDFSRPVYAPCRTPDNNNTLDPDTTACGVDPSLLYSSSGLTRGGLPATAVKDSASCITCDELPVTTTDEANAKYQCLWNRFGLSFSPPPNVDGPTLRNQIIARFKLLLETKASLLTDPDARQAILQFYQSDPNAQFDCDGGSTLTPVAFSPFCDPSLPDIAAGGLDFCERLLRPHVTAAEAFANAPYCVDLATVIRRLDPDCGFDGYKAQYLQVVPPVVQKAVADPLGGGNRQLAIQGRLKLMSRMYNAMRELSYVAELETSTRQVIGSFWKGLYGPEVDKLRNDPARIREVFDSEFAIDREVLSAAFAPALSEGVDCPHLVSTQGTPLPSNCDACVAYICTYDSYCCENSWDYICVEHQARDGWCTAAVPPTEPPMLSPALLYVVSDALTALSNRLEDVSLVQDLGCRFKTVPGSDSACRGGAVSTSTSALWQALAALPDSTALSTALGVSQLDPQWRPVFQAILSYHSGLETSVRNAASIPTYDPAILRGATTAPPPASARTLTNLITQAQSRSSRYTATGLFKAEADLLRGGLQDSRFTQIQSELNSEITQLGSAVSTYNTGLNDLVTALVQAADGTRAEQLIDNKLAINEQQFDNLSDQLVGFQTANTFDERRFGDFMQAFEKLNTSDAIDPNALVRKGSRTNLLVPAGAARFTSGSPDIASVAVMQSGAVWKQRVSGGDLVNIETSGTWSPSCALSTAQAPNGRPYGVTDARTGPEGYSLSVSNGSYAAKGTSDNDSRDLYLNISASAKACAGPNGPMGSAQVCAEISAGVKWDKTHTDTTSSGGESRTTAAFAVGLRLPNTPFPSMPAGALLLLQVLPGQVGRNAIIDVHVLHGPSSSILVPHDADLYLVVNDKAGCTTSADALTVMVQPLQPQAATAKQLSAAMSSVLDGLKSRAELASQRGVLTPTEISAMRDEAFAQVTSACACDFATYPAPLRELFGVWVNKELVGIERNVSLLKTRKDLEITALEREGLVAELLAEQNKRHIQALLPAWSMRTLDADAMRDTLHPLLETLTEEFFPFLLIKYPSALNHGSDAASRLDALLSSTWSTSTVDLADRVNKAALALMSEATTSVRDNPPSKKSDVLVLNYVRPGDEPTLGSVWRQASPERANAAWRAINEEDRRTASFTVRPEDLYSSIGGAAVLTCSDSAPVITSAALFVAIPSKSTGDRLSGQNWSVPATFGGDHQFPTAAGVTSYRFSDAWLSQGLPVLFGQDGDAVNVFRQFAGTGNVAEGLSPFTNFDVNLQALDVLSDGVNLAPGTEASVNELLLMLQVEARPIGSRVGDVLSCH